MTQFQQALIAASEGKLHTPTVSNSEGNIDYFSYQLAVRSKIHKKFEYILY